MKKVFVVFAALGALALGGCVESEKPILTDSKPVLGENLHLQFYGLRKGYAHDPEQADYVWKDGYYAHAAGGMKDITGFTVHPFERGNFIVQSKPNDPKAKIEYAVLRTLVDGVYQAVPIDEDDAAAKIRKANCHPLGKSSCRIKTRAQLWAFARATAAKRKNAGGLAIRLSDKK